MIHECPREAFDPPPGRALTFALLRRTASRPLPALLARSPAELRFRTPREGLQAEPELGTIRSIDGGRRTYGSVDLCLGDADRTDRAHLGVGS